MLNYLDSWKKCLDKNISTLSAYLLTLIKYFKFRSDCQFYSLSLSKLKSKKTMQFWTCQCHDIEFWTNFIEKHSMTWQIYNRLIEMKIAQQFRVVPNAARNNTSGLYRSCSYLVAIVVALILIFSFLSWIFFGPPARAGNIT